MGWLEFCLRSACIVKAFADFFECGLVIASLAHADYLFGNLDDGLFSITAACSVCKIAFRIYNSVIE